MGDVAPFIGTEALVSGALTRYELRRYYRAILPNVYLDKQLDPSLHQRTVGAWLWSGRQAVVAGLAASALHGAKWIDDDSPVELIWRNARVLPGSGHSRRFCARRRDAAARRSGRNEP